MPRARLRRYFRHGFLPQLMAFEACVRHGSVTRAAEELSLAQPTVSCMLRKLSDTLGGPVTVMRDRRIEPSALGFELLQLSREMMQALERFEHRLQGAEDPPGGTPGDGSGYDPIPVPDPDDSLPWHSSSRPRSPSRWKQRASQCPLARRRLEGADGVS
jgi:hypothetical protein